MSSDTVLWLVIAALNAFTAWMAWNTRVSQKESSGDIKKIEVATNSMKDALVKATGDAALLTGIEQGRQEIRDSNARK